MIAKSILNFGKIHSSSSLFFSVFFVFFCYIRNGGIKSRKTVSSNILSRLNRQFVVSLPQNYLRSHSVMTRVFSSRVCVYACMSVCVTIVHGLPRYDHPHGDHSHLCVMISHEREGTREDYTIHDSARTHKHARTRMHARARTRTRTCTCTPNPCAMSIVAMLARP